MKLPEHVVKAIRERRPFDLTWSRGRISSGGTYLIQSTPVSTDNRRPRDLVAILPGDLGHGRVIQLWIAVNPEFIDYLVTEVLDETEAVALS